MSMGSLKTAIASAGAPQAIGPYVPAQLVRLPGGGRMLFTAGQVGIDPESGQMVSGGIRAETERVGKNLTALLEAAGFTLSDVVKTTVFLADMQDFAAMNEVYQQFFSGAPPARTTVQAAALPRGARVEIEVVAVGREP
jgi:2-iminobutanoate/2-iminopropanoate deaminase